MSEKQNKKILEPLLLVAAIVVIVIVTTTVKGEDSIGDLERKQYENQSNQAQEESQASELESSKTDLEELVSEFNVEMESIGQELNDLDVKISDKQKQIKKTKKKLKKAKKEENEQYQAMKDRIQFLFESGNTNYLEIFLSNETLAESLNQAEYFSQLYDYDRKMLDKYKSTKKKIAKEKKALSEEKQELDKLKAETESKQSEVATMITTTNQKIQQYSDQIAEAESKAAEYQAQAEQLGNQIDEWHAESLRAQEESILQKQREEEANGGNSEQETSSPQNYTATELDLLASLIQAEAEDQPYYGKLAVGSVVVNRIRSSYFPNTMAGVLYQPYQFTPVTVNNRFALILARGANDECYQAAREVLGGNIVGSWLYFRVNDGSRTGTVIGAHVFY